MDPEQGGTYEPTVMYRYQDQDGSYDLSIADILRNYYPYWCEQMWRVHKAPMITEDNCLEDWIVIHWAWRV